jgi:hypothetical protein
MPEYPALLSVPIEDARRSTTNTIETVVRLEDDHGGDGYMARLEMFHQIHYLVSFFCMPNEKGQRLNLMKTIAGLSSPY